MLRFGFEYPEEDWRSLKGDLGALSYDVTFWLAALIDRQSANCFVELYIFIVTIRECLMNKGWKTSTFILQDRTTSNPNEH